MLEFSDKGTLKKFLAYIMLAFFLASLIALFVNFAGEHIDEDEVEHYHISWLLTRDIFPYKDIHQIHTPLLWMVFKPIVKVLPRSSYSFLVLRGVTLLFFFLLLIIGKNIVLTMFDRKIPEGVLWLYYVVFLSQAVIIQGYYFRPDVFMSFFAALGILFLLKPDRNWMNMLLSGIFMGFSIAFSPKIAPVVFFAFLLPFLGNKYSSASGKLLAITEFFGGILIGVFPVFLWLLKHNLLNDFYFWVFESNSSMLRSVFLVRTEYLKLAIVLLLSLAGFVYIRQEMGREVRRKLGFFLLFSLTIQVLDPNHLPYNLQVAMIPVSFLIGLFLFRFFSAENKARRGMGVLLLTIIFINPLLVERLIKSQSEEIGFREMDILMKLPGRETSCVAFAPEHPVFCVDSTQLYLTWDLLFPVSRLLSEKGKRIYAGMWKSAVEEIVRKKPDIIVDPETFSTAYLLGLISKKELKALHGLFKKSYSSYLIHKKIHVLLKETPSY